MGQRKERREIWQELPVDPWGHPELASRLPAACVSLCAAEGNETVSAAWPESFACFDVGRRRPAAWPVAERLPASVPVAVAVAAAAAAGGTEFARRYENETPLGLLVLGVVVAAAVGAFRRPGTASPWGRRARMWVARDVQHGTALPAPVTAAQ